MGKRGIALDLENEDGRRVLRELARKADFLLESFPPGTLEKWGLGYETLKADNRGLILVSITPFGQEGPYASFEAFDLEIMALGGAMALAGDEGGEPMRVTVPQAPLWAGVEAAMGALTALAYRSVTGRGQRVDVSAQAAVISALAHAPAFWDLNQINPERAGIYVTGRSVTGAKMRAFWPCRDGWINFIIYGGSAGRYTNQQLVAWMNERGMAPEWLKEIDWSGFSVPTLTQEDVDKLEAPVSAFFSALTKQEFLEETVRRGMLGYPVLTVEDISRDHQLKARGFWQEVPQADSGVTLRFPGGFAVINGQRIPIGKPLQRMSQRSEEVSWVEESWLSRGVPEEEGE